MSYHRFNNLSEAFAGDLTNKLNKNIGSKDFEPLQCNCNAGSRVDGQCIFGRECRKSMVVYKVKCSETGKVYIGNTQQKVKKRMEAHLGKVCNLANKNQHSDSFARHFASICQASDGNKLTRKDVRKYMTVEIMWEGNPITVMKTFGKPSCSLCMREKINILQSIRRNPKLTINTRSELYGACRHNTRFHRYTNYTISADEGQNSPERVSPYNIRPVLISPQDSNSPFFCSNCVSTERPLSMEEDNTALNACAACGILTFRNSRERQNFNFEAQNLNSELFDVRV